VWNRSGESELRHPRGAAAEDAAHFSGVQRYATSSRGRGGISRSGLGSRQDLPGPRNVFLYLLFQGLDRLEPAVAADIVDELDLDLATVKIALEVEQEDFQDRLAVVEGRPGAEIGCACAALPV